MRYSIHDAVCGVVNVMDGKSGVLMRLSHLAAVWEEVHAHGPMGTGSAKKTVAFHVEGSTLPGPTISSGDVEAESLADKQVSRGLRRFSSD